MSGLDSTFIIAGVSAIVFSYYAMTILETDMKEKNIRPVYALVMAIGSWITTYSLLADSTGIATAAEINTWLLFIIFAGLFNFAILLVYLYYYLYGEIKPFLTRAKT